MRVVFLEDVAGVAQGGDVKEVKNGFARNYLIPKELAVPATHNALQRVERLAKQAEVTRQETLSDMSALGDELDGVRVDIEMRSGTGGRLYGSVTSTMVTEELSRLIGREIDRRTVQIAEPIRQLGEYEVTVRLHPEVEPTVKVLVYALGTEPVSAAEAQEAEEAEAADAELDESEPATQEAAVMESEAAEGEGSNDTAEPDTVEAVLDDEPEPDSEEAVETEDGGDDEEAGDDDVEPGPDSEETEDGGDDEEAGGDDDEPAPDSEEATETEDGGDDEEAG